ncbi:hypothetical protein ACSYAD_17150 [Acaryochloris marina NIES-2412]|uniref:hypothetical protein n=1 Tax=Acaryochloris marina TaxID=155978 RepID=UPI004058C935
MPSVIGQTLKPSLSAVILSHVEEWFCKPRQTLRMPPKSPILGDFEIYDDPRGEIFKGWLEHNKAVPSVLDKH